METTPFEVTTRPHINRCTTLVPLMAPFCRENIRPQKSRRGILGVSAKENTPRVHQQAAPQTKGVLRDDLAASV